MEEKEAKIMELPWKASQSFQILQKVRHDGSNEAVRKRVVSCHFTEEAKTMDFLKAIQSTA